jgi:zinc protease
MLFSLFFYLLFCPAHNLAALEHYTLDNGLEVFLVENHTTPLMHFRIVFRTGSINEDEKTNGLSHLYEHLMFQGNDLYKNQNAIASAFKSLGTASWNGSTGTEKVNYFFTVPTAKTEKAIELWAHAVINPSLDKEALLKTRPVVHNEDAGYHVKPSYIFRKKINETLYYKYPYRKNNVGGNISVIDNASIEQLRYFKDNFYVPNNAAVIIAGDINSPKTLEMVKKYFGSWKKAAPAKDIEPHPPLTADKWVALDNQPSKGQISVQLIFMGPDSGTDTKTTYPADIWSTMTNEPDSNFKKNVYKAVPELFGETRNINVGYETEKEATTDFVFTLTIDREKDMLAVIKRLVKTVDNEISKMQKSNYYTDEALRSAKRQSNDNRLLSMETIEGYCRTIELWWAATSTNYYLDYPDRIEKVTMDDVTDFVKKILNRPKLVAIWVNKDDNLNIKLVERIK